MYDKNVAKGIKAGGSDGVEYPHTFQCNPSREASRQQSRCL
nr:MAG TPA: hypothetical protein [Caudoviricetes sp.]